MHTCVYLYVYIYIYIHACVCVYIYIYIYTYTRDLSSREFCRACLVFGFPGEGRKLFQAVAPMIDYTIL